MSEPHLQTPAAMSVPAFHRWAGIGRTTTFNEVRSGRMKAVKVNCRTLATYAESERWLTALPTRKADRWKER